MWYGLSRVPEVPGFLGIVSSSDSESRDPSVIVLSVGGLSQETYPRVVNLNGLNSQVHMLFTVQFDKIL